MSHPPELRERALALRKQGMLIREIAVALEVSKPTVLRWTNPTLEARERENARKKKFSKHCRCPSCRQRMSNNASLCIECARAKQTKDRYWNQERIVDAIRAWALQHGHPPTYSEWERSGSGHPTVYTVCRDGPNPPFAKWSDAIRAAGFKAKQRRSRLTKRERQDIRRRAGEDKLKKALWKGE
jgi:Homing endonuclease associated repeat